MLVFDTGDQCQAFIDALAAKPHVSLEGDLFLDGRAVADAFGVPAPDPEYELLRTGATRREGEARGWAASSAKGRSAT